MSTAHVSKLCSVDSSRALEASQLVRDEPLPDTGAGERQRPPQVRAQCDAVERAGNDRIVALHAACLCPLEASARARGRDAGDTWKPTVERAVEDSETPPAQPLQREPVGEPRREADDRHDRRL